MDFQTLINQFLPVLGQAGVTALAEQLKDLAASTGQPWQKILLNLTAEAVEKHGPKGIDLARDAIDDMIAKRPPQIDWANPRTASDLVAALQNAEADEKSAARDYFVKVGHVLGQILTATVKSIVASV